MDDEYKYTYGTDSINIPKIIILMLMIVAILVLAFYTTNVPELQTKALIYWIFIISTGVAWLFSKVITKTYINRKKKIEIDFPNPIIYESRIITGYQPPRWVKILLFFSAIALGIFLFVSAGSSPSQSILGSPKYQIIQITDTVSAILTIVSAVAEDLTFWVVTPVLIGGFILLILHSLLRLDKRIAFWISIILVIILNPIVWTLFHTNAYGMTDIQSTTTVFIYGLFMTSITVITRTIWFPLFTHAPINVANDLFKNKVVEVQSMGLIAFIILGVLLVFTLKFFGKGKRNEQ